MKSIYLYDYDSNAGIHGLDQTEFAKLGTAKRIRNALVHLDGVDPDISVTCYDENYKAIDYYHPVKEKLNETF